MKKIGLAFFALAPAVFPIGCESEFDKCFAAELQRAWEADAETVACAQYSQFNDEQRLDANRAVAYALSVEGAMKWRRSAFDRVPSYRESLEGCADSVDEELVNAMEEEMLDRMLALQETDIEGRARVLLMGAEELYELVAEDRARIATKVCNGKGFYK